MLYFISLFIIILIFPLVLTCYLYFDTKLEKSFFAIYVFGFIKIIDGYITKRNQGGIYIHIKNKAIIVDKFSFNSFKGGTGIFKLLQITEFDSYVNFATNSFYLYYLTIFLNVVKNIAFKVLDNNYFLKTPKTSVDLITGEFEFQIKTRFKILFNIFCITYYLITNYISKGVQNVKATK